MLDRIESIHDEGLAAIDRAGGSDELEELRVRLLGRKAELPNLLRGVAELPPEERGKVGKRANEVRQALTERLNAVKARIESAELDTRLAADRIDVTLPGDPVEPVGRHHLISQTLREIEDVFVGLGFTVVEGPEVETVHYNFDALNHEPTHPARGRADTFYVAE
ncbi:MAG: phenylalanine--tRNA ligase subunit alpha, partial [Solirubrobacterales bacterium]|nr:phenylalanine--tRNA ligase subunit alpha [Solirubrobacterales bacterium]